MHTPPSSLPVGERVANPATGPATERVVDPATGPAADRVTGPAADRVTDPVDAYVRALQGSVYGRQVTHHRITEPTTATYATLHRHWPAAMDNILAERGLKLYSHQAECIDYLRAGRDCILTTPTASGKTLTYSLPLIESFLRDPDTRALWIFPLKALARDQLGAFERLTAHWPAEARPTAAIYDGDTSAHFRRKIRNNPPNVLITNPEMLHLSLLPYHGQWTTFLATLQYIVLDEAHTCRGVQGAHMAQVLRRLGRICARYGCKPVRALCSATVGNPAELATNLLGTEANAASAASSASVAVVSQSGAPTGRRHFLFLNPELCGTISASAAAIDLLRAALARNLRTIVYCRSRRMTETLALWAADKSGPLRNKISAYRAGFLPEERRDIEERMASGELLAVISTSALELGIDIGALDLCILVGYPGTVMSTVQRGGRVGRTGRESAVVLIAGEDALDQYFMRNPEAFFSRPPELAVVNPYNEVILARHLECAAAEQPLRLSPMEPWLMDKRVHAAANALAECGLLLPSADGHELMAARKRPQRHVSLRGCGNTFTIFDENANPLGTVDGQQALRETHPGALYLHRGHSYEIEALDPVALSIKARLLPKRPGWFTRVRSHKLTEILEVQRISTESPLPAALGRLRVTETLTGYEKRSLAGNRLLNIVPFSEKDVPPLIFETEGFWFTIPDEFRRAVEDARLHFMGGIHALEHACIGLLPLLVMADRNDFGGISTPFHAQLAAPAVFVYDGLPGGAGLASSAFPKLAELLGAVRELLLHCPCETGCPSCVHSPKCGSGNRPIDKEAAKFLSACCGGDPRQAAPDIVVDTPSQSAISGIQSGNHAGTHVAVASGTHAAVASGTPHGFAALPESYVVFDVETRLSAAEVGGWSHLERMGVSVAVLYDSRDDSFAAYSQERIPEMVERMASAALVVGFNSVRFDYPVLQPFTEYPLHTLPSMDLLAEIYRKLSFRVSLDNVARATLNVPKSADGLAALRWWKQGRLDLIAEYCQKDVEITRDVYRYAVEHKHVLFTNKAGSAVRCVLEK